MSTPQEPGPDFQPQQYNPIPQQPGQGEPQQVTPQPAPAAAPRAWYKRPLFLVPAGVVVLGAALGLGASLGRTTAQPAPTALSSSGPTASPSVARLSLSESCTSLTSTVKEVVDFGYDDEAGSDTADSLATRLRQNVAQSADPVRGDVTLLITNLDKIQDAADTTTMTVADFTEPGQRILVACGVNYISLKDPDLGSDPTADDTEDEPADEPADEPQEETKYDKLSDEQQDAYGAAQSYLDSSGFSKAGLIDQLSSEYGDDFARKDAKKAVEALDDVDWNEEAVEAATSYRKSSHFSTNGLIEQLESDYGDQFTHSQAVYGAKHSR